MQKKYLVLLIGIVIFSAYINPLKAKAIDYGFDTTYICGHGVFTLATNTPSYFCSFLQFAPAPATDFYALPVKTTSSLRTIIYANNNVFGGTGTSTLWLGKFTSSTNTFSTTSLGSVKFDTVTPQRERFDNINIDFSPGDRFILGYNNTGTVKATNLGAEVFLFFNETSTIQIMTSSTDAIVGNYFNLLYVFSAYFIILFTIYLIYKIFR